MKTEAEKGTKKIEELAKSLLKEAPSQDESSTGSESDDDLTHQDDAAGNTKVTPTVTAPAPVSTNSADPSQSNNEDEGPVAATPAGAATPATPGKKTGVSLLSQKEDPQQNSDAKKSKSKRKTPSTDAVAINKQPVETFDLSPRSPGGHSGPYDVAAPVSTASPEDSSLPVSKTIIITPRRSLNHMLYQDAPDTEEPLAKRPSMDLSVAKSSHQSQTIPVFSSALIPVLKAKKIFYRLLYRSLRLRCLMTKWKPLLQTFWRSKTRGTSLKLKARDTKKSIAL